MRALRMAALAGLALVSCAAPGSRTQTSAFLGESRSAPGEDAAGSRALSVDEAAALLETAVAGADHAAILVLANQLAAAGRALDAATTAAVLVAVDALRGDALAAIHEALAPGALPAHEVALRLALVAEHGGDDAAALAFLERAADAEPLSVHARDAARALRRRVAARARIEPGIIAVLLPQTGRHAALGAELEAGVRVAARGLGDDVELRFLDTGGDEAGAILAVERAFFEHRALAILGPVGERESRRAAARAAELGIPIALLAPGDGAAAPEAGVFRLWSSPAWEARQAARLAVALGYDRLAVLAPRDEHGARAARAFTDAARAEGVAVVASGDYDPTATALEPDLKAFLGLEPARNARLRQHLRQRGKAGWKTFSPDVAFDLLYIPDEYQRAALVASYLPFFNVEVRSRDVMDILALRRKHRGRVPQVVQLLGSSGWHHPGLIPRGGAAVEGALVIDVFSGGEDEAWPSEEAALFAHAFEAQLGRRPGALAAQAHDAALLVLEARARVAGQGGQGSAAPGGRALRRAFVRALAALRLTTGACGPARMGPAGQIEREAVLLRVHDGAFLLHEH